MEQEYRWSETRDGDSSRLPGPEHIGRWAAAAMFVSLLLHVLVFFALDNVRIALGIAQPGEIATAAVTIRQQVEVKPFQPESAAPTEKSITPPDDTAPLLEEVDLIDLLPKDSEIDMAPSVLDPEFALKISSPLAAGELEGEAEAVASTFDLESSVPEFGRMETELEPAALGQIIVDPGAVQVDDGEMTSFTNDLIKKGNNGLVDNGKLEGIESLDEMLNLPPNLLISKRTLLPSDLIFEFNSYDLRESAKVGLMKLALLIDKNPGLFCWIEGHTDLIGTDEANLILSEKRAEAVKTYLVRSLKMDSEKIVTTGFGKSQPLVVEGDADAQGPNRRVEIKMRNEPPPDLPIKITPKAIPVEEAVEGSGEEAVEEVVEEEVSTEPEMTPEPEPPKAVLVRPALGEEMEPPKASPVPQRAIPVPEVQRAIPVEP